MVFRDIIWPVAMTANVPHNGTNEKGMLNRQEGVTRLDGVMRMIARLTVYHRLTIYMILLGRGHHQHHHQQ